jgi:hypothetical protein
MRKRSLPLCVLCVYARKRPLPLCVCTLCVRQKAAVATLCVLCVSLPTNIGAAAKGRTVAARRRSGRRYTSCSVRRRRREHSPKIKWPNHLTLKIKTKKSQEKTKCQVFLFLCLKLYYRYLQSTYCTYVEYRAVSDVFQNIDPRPPL